MITFFRFFALSSVLPLAICLNIRVALSSDITANNPEEHLTVLDNVKEQISDTPVFSPTPFPIPTPTPVPVCSSYEVRLDKYCWHRDLARGGFAGSVGCPMSWSEYDDLKFLRNYYGMPVSEYASCLNNYIQQARQIGLGFSTDGRYIFDKAWGSAIFTAQELINLGANSGGTWSCSGYLCYPVVSPIVIYVDRDCNRVAPTANVCGTASTSLNAYTISPISLSWEEGEKIPESHNLSQFPLEPIGKSDTWYIWKASAEFPLLVYDPRHSGEITSAAQLFGSFTFDKKWKHGFEALETLDTNKDGEVSGEELTPLGLWFDQNRDGISQPGEVKATQDVGLKTLYFKLDKIPTSGEDIILSKGFKREKDGLEIIGKAVDWFVQSGGSKSQAVTADEVKTNLMSNIKQNSDSKSNSNLPTPSQQNQNLPKTVTSPVNGMWRWQADEDDAYYNAGIPGGLLILNSDGKNLYGNSIIETPLSENNQGVRAALSVFPIRGSINKDKDGRIRLNFKTHNNSGYVETKAFYDIHGDTLKGISSKEFHEAIGKNGSPYVFKYSWTAVR